MSPPLAKRNFVSLLSVAGTWGKFLLLWEVRIRCSVRLSRLIGGWGTFGKIGKMGLGFMGSFSG